MKLSDKEIEDFRYAYHERMQLLWSAMRQYEHSYIQALRESDLSCKHEMSNLAEDAFVHKLKGISDEAFSIYENMKEVKRLLE